MRWSAAFFARFAALPAMLPLLAVSLHAAQLPAVTYEGRLSDITDKLIVLELDGGRAFNFKLAGNTQFSKAGREVAANALRPGDRVSIVARLDDRAFLVAVKVSYVEVTPEMAAEIAARVKTLRAAAAREKAYSESAAGGPVLKRRDEGGSPPDAGPEGEHGAGPEAASATSFGRSSGPTLDNDPLIAKAREAALDFSDALPNFLCEEQMSRFAKNPSMTGWSPRDVISAEVIYEDGKESYRNVKINGRATGQPMEQLSGSWSTGEFATTMRNLFHPASDTKFRRLETAPAADPSARVYEFAVEQANSRWNIEIGGRRLTPAYAGSVWLDPDTGRVLRLEMHAVGLPADFPLQRIESSVAYSLVEIGGEQVLLPSHAENLGCRRSGYCSRNVIDFGNYRKYVSDSRIEFGP